MGVVDDVKSLGCAIEQLDITTKQFNQLGVVPCMGTSNHMCGNEHFFKDLTKVKVGDVSFGDDSKVVVKGQGTIWYL